MWYHKLNKDDTIIQIISFIMYSLVIKTQNMRNF